MSQRVKNVYRVLLQCQRSNIIILIREISPQRDISKKIWYQSKILQSSFHSKKHQYVTNITHILGPHQKSCIIIHIWRSVSVQTMIICIQ
jgi:hypothetical protein